MADTKLVHQALAHRELKNLAKFENEPIWRLGENPALEYDEMALDGNNACVVVETFPLGPVKMDADKGVSSMAAAEGMKLVGEAVGGGKRSPYSLVKSKTEKSARDLRLADQNPLL